MKDTYTLSCIEEHVVKAVSDCLQTMIADQLLIEDRGALVRELEADYPGYKFWIRTIHCVPQITIVHQLTQEQTALIGDSFVPNDVW